MPLAAARCTPDAVHAGLVQHGRVFRHQRARACRQLCRARARGQPARFRAGDALWHHRGPRRPAPRGRWDDAGVGLAGQPDGRAIRRPGAARAAGGAADGAVPDAGGARAGAARRRAEHPGRARAAAQRAAAPGAGGRRAGQPGAPGAHAAACRTGRPHRHQPRAGHARTLGAHAQRPAAQGRAQGLGAARCRALQALVLQGGARSQR